MNQHQPLLGRELALTSNAGFTIRPLPDCARFSLRIDPQNLEGASSAFGATLPTSISGLTSQNGKLAACIGPDEWVLIAPLAEQQAIEQAFAAIYTTTLHSLVDIGHREVAIAVDGPEAAHLLQAAIAFDVEVMPIGSACRTIIDRVQIILLRETTDHFRVEVWTSFADHVWHLLAGIGREIELGV